MSQTGLAIGHALFLWWFGTGAVLYLDGLPRRTYPWTLAGASLLAAAALALIGTTRDATGVTGAHVGFAAAVAVWAWNEVLFLTGTVTGPRRTARPLGDIGWRHFRNAAETVIYHELALAGSAAVIAALTLGGSNRVALWTFLTLWAMRLSTKLNIFLGVRNLGESFLPDHLAYLASYFRRAPMNPLFPVSVALTTALLVGLVATVAAPGTDAAFAVGLTLIATLVGLALLEHWFLVLPLDPATLWRWGFKSREVRPVGGLPTPSDPGPSGVAGDRPRRKA